MQALFIKASLFSVKQEKSEALIFAHKGKDFLLIQINE